MVKWTMNFVDDTDQLVHIAHEGYPRRSPETIGGYPQLAHTRCGHLITVTDGVVNAGRFVPRDTMPTCVRCLGGAQDGEVQRQTLKMAAFGILYGRSVDSVLQDYSETEARSIRQWLGRSVYRRCSRLAHALYCKAVA